MNRYDRFRLLTTGFSILIFAGAAFAAGDVTRGAAMFRQCMACHSTEAGEHLTGPSLAHAFGKKAASADGFQRYSDALKRARITWNETTLEAWLADPERFVPGNGMTFPGVRDAQARQDLIAYLKAVANNSAPSGQPSSGIRGRPASRPDLKNAPPEGRVTSITHCGDTYTVGTADGKSQKIWEYNLRFKSDSGKLGPAPGQPVVIGSGMQGDRASVVFSSPREISDAIKQSCG
jgi:cytochrome c